MKQEFVKLVKKIVTENTNQDLLNNPNALQDALYKAEEHYPEALKSSDSIPDEQFDQLFSLYSNYIEPIKAKETKAVGTWTPEMVKFVQKVKKSLSPELLPHLIPFVLQMAAREARMRSDDAASRKQSQVQRSVSRMTQTGNERDDSPGTIGR